MKCYILILTARALFASDDSTTVNRAKVEFEDCKRCAYVAKQLNQAEMAIKEVKWAHCYLRRK